MVWGKHKETLSKLKMCAESQNKLDGAYKFSCDNYLRFSSVLFKQNIIVRKTTYINPFMEARISSLAPRIRRKKL